MPLGRRLLIAGGILVLLGVGVFAFLAFKVMTFEHPSGYDFVRTDTARHPIVPIAEANVTAEAPGLHALLEEALASGRSGTTDFETRQQVRLYLHRLTGSPELNLVLQYKGQLFELRQWSG